MGLLFVCLAAHDSESRRWTSGVDCWICQTFAASPAEPGELPLWFRLKPELQQIPMTLDWRVAIEQFVREYVQPCLKIANSRHRRESSISSTHGPRVYTLSLCGRG